MVCFVVCWFGDCRSSVCCGKKLERRKEFAGDLEKDLVRLTDVVKTIKFKQEGKLKELEMMKVYVDSLYFPDQPQMREVLDLAQK